MEVSFTSLPGSHPGGCACCLWQLVSHAARWRLEPVQLVAWLLPTVTANTLQPIVARASWQEGRAGVVLAADRVWSVSVFR